MPPEPIYLCTIGEFAGSGASDERILRKMTLLAGILNKLGWDLASGTNDRFHELWAVSREAVVSSEKQPLLSVAAFEELFLAWLRARRIIPESVSGETRWWTLRYSEWRVEVGLNELAGGDWRLTILEPPPREFTGLVALHFDKPEADLVVQDDGRVRTEFLGRDLLNGFPALGDNGGTPEAGA